MRHTVNIPIVNILSSHNDRLLHGLTCFLNLQSRRWKKEIPIINMLFTWAAAIDSKNNKLELGRVESTNEASQTQFHQMWSLFRRKAKEHDYALIEAWREDCNVVMIFAGLYSAGLIALLVASYPTLKQDPASETSALIERLTILNSQLRFNDTHPGGTLTLASSPSPFQPSASNVRVNTFWFASLVLSLSAALSCTIVQQWVRDYTQVYALFHDPLYGARVSQFLYQGTKKFNMKILLTSIPSLIHLSLFLFFIGLIDFLFAINTIVASITTCFVAVCSGFYIFCTLSPFWNLESPYETPLSSVFWWILYTLGVLRAPHLLTARGNLAIKAHNQEQHREICIRDAKALHWLICQSRQEDDLEEFLTCLPAFLGSHHGREIWNTIQRDGKYWSPYRGLHDDKKRLRKENHTLKAFAHRIVHLLTAAVRDGKSERIDMCLEAMACLVFCSGDLMPVLTDRIVMPNLLRLVETKRSSGWLCITLMTLTEFRMEDNESVQQDIVIPVRGRYHARGDLDDAKEAILHLRGKIQQMMVLPQEADKTLLDSFINVIGDLSDNL